MEIRDRIKELRRVRASELIPNPRNWRKHPTAQAQALRAMLLDVGYADALIARELTDGRLELIDGHLRAETTPDAIVPVLVLDVTQEEADKLLLTLDPMAAMAEADNGRLKELLESVRIDNDAVRELLKHTAGDRLWATIFPKELDDAEIAPGRADELRQKWGTEVGQLWQVGPNRIFCGDCTDPAVLDRLFSGDCARARLICADAPYGVSYANKNRLLNKSDRGNRIQKRIINDHLPEEKTGDLFRTALTLAAGHCLPGAVVYASVPGGPLLVRFITALDEAGFVFKSTLVWVKNQFVIGMSDYHFRHELVLYAWLRNGAHFWNGGRSQDSVFEVDRPRVSDLHPTSKPIELLARMISNSSLPGELVYDPFCGSGSTLVAAHQLGRSGSACELDPGYVGVTLERLSMLGLKPQLVK